MITYKTKEEIVKLEAGGKKLATIVRQAAKMVLPGIKTIDIDSAVREMIQREGGMPAFLNYTPLGADRPYPAAICISVNSEVVHGIPSEYVLKEGDIVGLDCGLVYEGMYTDHAVTVPVGVVREEVAELLAVTKKALAVGIAAAGHTGHVGDISAAIEQVLTAGGYGIVREFAGHGVGHKVHEEPFVPNYGKAGSGPKLSPGMVLALEPMATLGNPEVETDETDGYTVRTVDSSLAAHFEHTIAITENGVIVITKE